MKSLGAFIVTYDRQRELERSLGALRAQSRPPDHILVIDNGRSEVTRQLVASFRGPVVEYHATPGDLGSAGGTSLGTSMLSQRGSDYIYSGDDNNQPRTDDSIERVLDLLEQSFAQVGGAGIVGARWSWRRGEVDRLEDKELHGPIDVDFIGGDHKLTLRRDAAISGGPPREDLFFGYPDLEHCLRLRRSGYRPIIDGGSMLEYLRNNQPVGLQVRRRLMTSRRRDEVWRYCQTQGTSSS